MTTDSIAERIEVSRTELLDLSLRNPLVNYRLLRAKGVEATDGDSDKVFRDLVRGHKLVRFTDSESKSIAANNIATAETPEQLDRRLLKTYYDANTLIQEQGVNTLFVALGMVHWYESNSSDIERKAPLILVPVQLERADVNSKFGMRYSGEDLDANIAFIQKVQQDFGIKMPSLPADDESDAEDLDVGAYFAKVASSIEGMKRWSVDDASVVLGFFSFNKLLMYKDLDPESWTESGGLLERGIIRALFETGFREAESEIGENAFLDDHLDAEDVFHVVDADSSQAKAIHDVKSGRSMVIQGPPGTGKSQTITNIIAEGVAQGKKVLFVAEKMAALEVVKHRLDSIGLGDACLELHSNKTQKRAVIDDLKRTLELGEPRTDGIDDDFVALNQIRNRLNSYAIAVNTAVGETGVTPYDAYGEFLRIAARDAGEDLPRLRIAEMSSWAPVDYQRKASVVSELQTVLGSMGSPSKHMFRGSQRQLITPTFVDDLRDTIAAALESNEALFEAGSKLGGALGLKIPKSSGDVSAMIALSEHFSGAPDARGVKLSAMRRKGRRQHMRDLLKCHKRSTQLHSEYDTVLKSEAWKTDVAEMHGVLTTTGRSFLKRLFSSEYKSVRSAVQGLCVTKPSGDVDQLITFVEAILEEQLQWQEIEDLSPTAEAVLGPWWMGEDTDWQAVSRIVEWALALLEEADDGKFPHKLAYAVSDIIDDGKLKNLSQKTRSILEKHLTDITTVESILELDNPRQFRDDETLSSMALEKQRSLLRKWERGVNNIREVARFNLAASMAEEEDLSVVVDLARRWKGASNRLSVCFEKARYSAILSRAIEERASLAEFDTGIHQQRIDQFRQMDELSLEHNRARVTHVHWSDLPKYGDMGQVGILRREFAKRRRHLPLRQLMERAGNAVQAIKPVFMMSPLSVATYLKPGGIEFDLVVFDEASQVKPVDALGALIRGSQSVVVGDDRQLPPTDFFSAVNQDDDDDSESMTADMESILSLFSAQGAPSRMLRWHYRSRHESLITVSNQEFYDNRLIVFPSPNSRSEGVGLQYHWLDTQYASGVNREEARYVARAVMEHAREHPDMTLGVAAFSVRQRDAVQDELEILRRQNDEHESYFNAHPDEPFFVKNLENVQGDERDVIFISVGYGRQADGRVFQNFGPLNRDGGERRLNVLISRAKLRCDVFTNLHADDIRLTASSGHGVRAFKTFLSFAESGEIVDIPTVSGREAGSPFQQEVADRLRSKGYEVHDEVSSSGFFVDIGIVDPDRPGRYILGIECDGAAYHSSRSARERDRLRELVLSGLGWGLHRIWSTDWFNDPERELSRAIRSIEEAVTSRRNGVAKAKDEGTAIISNLVKPVIQRAEVEQDGKALEIPSYRLVEPLVNTGDYGLGDAPIGNLTDAIIEVVETESPVHEDEIIRRITVGSGTRRAGQKIKENIQNAIAHVVKQGNIHRRGDFLWSKDMQNTMVRDRGGLKSQHRKIEYIAPEEIAEAINLVVGHSHGIEFDDLASQTVKLLGFKSASAQMKKTVDSVASGMIADGRLKSDGIHLTIR